MDKIKTNKEGSAKIVSEVSITKTLSLLPHKKTVRFTRQEFPVKEISLASAVSRMNKESAEYSYSIDPATADFLITRN